MARLDDTVMLDPGVRPEDVEKCLIEAVNLGWRAGGNDGRCNVPANFVGWALQEIERMRAALRKVADPSIPWGHMKLIARETIGDEQ